MSHILQDKASSVSWFAKHSGPFSAWHCSRLVLRKSPSLRPCCLLRTPPWPCRTPHSTGFEYRQQDGTIDRLNRHGCYDFGLSSTCQVHRKAAARQHHHSGESSWLLYYDKSGQLSNTVFTREITRKSTLTRIRIAFRPHYISDSSRIWGSLTFMKRWPVGFQTFGLHFKYYQSIISHCRSQTPHKECQKNSNTVDLKQYWRPSPPPPTY